MASKVTTSRRKLGWVVVTVELVTGVLPQPRVHRVGQLPPGHVLARHSAGRQAFTGSPKTPSALAHAPESTFPSALGSLGWVFEGRSWDRICAANGSVVAKQQYPSVCLLADTTPTRPSSPPPRSMPSGGWPSGVGTSSATTPTSSSRTPRSSPPPAPATRSVCGWRPKKHLQPLTKPKTHTVVTGDTLYSLARRWNSTVAEVMNTNRLRSTLIKPGQVLVTPS
jgi:hypothetical protein